MSESYLTRESGQQVHGQAKRGSNDLLQRLGGSWKTFTATDVVVLAAKAIASPVFCSQFPCLTVSLMQG